MSKKLIKRILSEKIDLDLKIWSLRLFIKNNKFKKLNSTQRGAIKLQKKSMIRYSEMLLCRIINIRKKQ